MNEFVGRNLRRSRQISAVKLVHPLGDRRSARKRDPEAVARAPSIRAQDERVRFGRDVASNELAVALKAAGRETRGCARTLVQWLAEPDFADPPSECRACLHGIDPRAGRDRVARLAREYRDSERLEPSEIVVQPLVDQPLEVLIPPRALLPESRPVPVPPDEAPREEEGASGPVALLEDYDRGAELARASRGDEPSHACAGDGQIGH